MNRRLSDSEIIIRTCKPSDLSACRELYLQLVQWHRELYHDPTIGEPDPYSGLMDHIREHGEENLWVAEAEGVIVGLVGLVFKDDEAEVEPLVVAESHRRQGIGAQLLRHVTEIAREAGARYLNVRPVARNWQAIQFYYAAGFRTLGFIELFQDLRGQFKNEPGPEILGIPFDW